MIKYLRNRHFIDLFRMLSNIRVYRLYQSSIMQMEKKENTHVHNIIFFFCINIHNISLVNRSIFSSFLMFQLFLRQSYNN